MVRQLTAQHLFIKGNSYGVRNYWFTFLVECNGIEFIIKKKNGWIIEKIDRKKVKWKA